MPDLLVLLETLIGLKWLVVVFSVTFLKSFLLTSLLLNSVPVREWAGERGRSRIQRGQFSYLLNLWKYGEEKVGANCSNMCFKITVSFVPDLYDPSLGKARVGP